MKTNERLTSAEVYFVNGIPYINIEYEYEDVDGTHKIVFPKVEFPFNIFEIPYVNFGGSEQFISEKHALSRLELFKGPVAIKIENGIVCRNDVTFLDVITKKKVHEMTLEEIEKRLGYSVKIVTKENKND